jgi:16S rRNA (adenine1518-N6/adenine1519-N6)-dimethyltransferase
MSDLTPVERLRRSGVTPDRALGQNFLIDPNILDVIEKTAALSSDDTVLEVGPGLGVLTDRLVSRCGLVHCIEMDNRLTVMLEEEFGGRPGFSFHHADAMDFPLATLDPPPGKFVANLPYNVAAPLVMKSLEELPQLKQWCLMLQKEIADRFFAVTGAANYGGISVRKYPCVRYPALFFIQGRGYDRACWHSGAVARAGSPPPTSA